MTPAALANIWLALENLLVNIEDSSQNAQQRGDRDRIQELARLHDTTVENQRLVLAALKSDQIRQK